MYIKRFDDQHAILGGDPLQLADVVDEIAHSGIDVLALSESSLQIDLITSDSAGLETAAREHGWKLGPKKSAFLVQDEGGPEAVNGILHQLGDARIPVTAMQGISAGGGRFGAILWVKPEDVDRAGAVLKAAAFDPVQESSEESFPASDAPAWASR